jgi:hypothetical protein
MRESGGLLRGVAETGGDFGVSGVTGGGRGLNTGDRCGEAEALWINEEDGKRGARGEGEDVEQDGLEGGVMR